MTDDRAKQGQQWLEQLLKLAGLPVPVTIGESSIVEEDSQWLVIDHSQLTPDHIETLTGADGTVLDSIQYLANTILNLGQERDLQGAYTIELDGYRVRRHAQLQEMAEHAANRARETGEEFELKSLSSAERRQIHNFLKQFTDLETYSRGQEPDRRLVVRLLQS